MKGGIIVLLMGIIPVICKKCECSRNIRAGVSINSIDTDNNVLIYLFLSEKIGVRIIKIRDQVYLVTRAIRSHIRDLADCMYGESMGS